MITPEERRVQREHVAAFIRSKGVFRSMDIDEVRTRFDELLLARPAPLDIVAIPERIGAVPVLHVNAPNSRETHVLLYVHGGGYIAGSARSSVALAGEIARRTGTTVVVPDYRLAPEHAYPAALDDVRHVYIELARRTDSAISLIGESAGGGLAAALTADLLARQMPIPASVTMFSPFADLSASSDSMRSKASVDPVITPEAARIAASHYRGDHSELEPLVSPIHASFIGAPPMLIQVGSYEVLLDDALRLTARAAADDVAVRLEVWPGSQHVFQSGFATLADAADALELAPAFIRDHDERDPGAG